MLHRDWLLFWTSFIDLTGREGDGVSQEFLEAADKRLHLPQYGFSDSFNVSVACALILQRLLSLYKPGEPRGDLCDQEKADLRRLWYTKLAKTPKTRQEYAEWLASANAGRPAAPLKQIMRDNTTSYKLG